MRSHLANGLAIVLLAAFFGIPWGLYNEQVGKAAQSMSHEEWLAMMGYTQDSQTYSVGLTGTFIYALIICAGLAAIYEFTKVSAGMFIDRVMGPEKSGYIKSLTQ